MHSAQATVIGRQVYVGGGHTESEEERFLVCKYDPVKSEWSTLPPAPLQRCGIGQMNGKLVLVGGTLEIESSLHLVDDFSFEEHLTADVHVFEDSQQWEKSIPAMPVPCRDAVVLSHNSFLVVCDGVTATGLTLATVYVYNGLTSQWSSSESLSVLCGSFNAVTVGSSCIVRTGERSVSLTTLPSCSVLQELPRLPYAYSSIGTLGGSILAIGGSPASLFKAYTSAEVYAYCPTTASWIHNSDLPGPQSKVATAALPSGELLVMGGKNKKNNISDTVFMGSIEIID